MADTTTKGGLDFLKQKVGPLPLGVWLVAGVGLTWYFGHKQAASSASQAPNQQTDPAGNIGSIDPATGYVYGTPEDTAALAANNAGTSSDTGGAGQAGTPGQPTYTDNNAWGIAAVNYLVGLGIDATTANQAIQLYLSSQPLTSAQQADVNLAIGRLGPPPTLPGPVSGNPPPVTTPPGGKPPGGLPPGGKPPVPGGGGGKPPPKPKTPPPPTALRAAAVHSTSVVLTWKRATGATGYHITITDMASKKVAWSKDVGNTGEARGFGMQPLHSYVADVWSLPRANGNAPHAEVSFKTTRTG